MRESILSYVRQQKSSDSKSGKVVAPKQDSPASLPASMDPDEDVEELKTFNRRRKRVNPNPAADTTLSPIENTKLATAKNEPLMPSTSKKTVRKTQMHLDVGQRDFFVKRCETCGLVYTPGDPEDERLHRLEHAKIAKGIRHASQPNEKILFKDCQLGNIIALYNKGTQGRELGKLVQFLEQELGTVPGWVLPNSSDVSVVAYVASDTSLITGCVVLEKVRKASPLVRPASSTASGGVGTGVALLADSSTKISVEWGVRLMWVSKDARRCGIATKLLDTARSFLLPGYVIPKSKLAFTQPTEQGTAFIEHYTDNRNFLVYGG